MKAWKESVLYVKEYMPQHNEAYKYCAASKYPYCDRIVWICENIFFFSVKFVKIGV